MTKAERNAAWHRRAGIMGAALGAILVSMPLAASADELTVWSGYPEMVPFYKHVAESMKADYPDLTVNVQAIPLRDHEKRVALGVTSGSAGDVIELAVSTATRYMQNDLLAKAPDDTVAYVDDPANFNKFFADAGKLDGTLYGVPLFRGQSALFYNTDMFKAAGLSEPPKTMDEMTGYAAKLAERDANGNLKVSGWSLRLSGGGQGIAEKFWINMFQYGGNLLEETGGGKWKAAFANEAGHKTLAQYLDVVYGDKADSVAFPADADAFERGQTAMFIRESWVISDIAAKAPDLHYATTTLPMGSIVAPVDMFVPASSSKAKEAWAFAKAATSAENQLWLLANVGWLPNRAGLDYSAILAKTPQFGAFVNYPADYKFFTLPTIGPADELLTRIAAQLTNAFGNSSLQGNDKAIDETLQTAADEADGILKREGLLAE